MGKVCSLQSLQLLPSCSGIWHLGAGVDGFWSYVELQRLGKEHISFGCVLDKLTFKMRRRKRKKSLPLEMSH